MTIFVVLENSGGWCGAEPYYNVYRAFSTREAAKQYIKEKKAKASSKEDLWGGEIHEALLDA